jgi:hypothetical protein
MGTSATEKNYHEERRFLEQIAAVDVIAASHAGGLPLTPREQDYTDVAFSRLIPMIRSRAEASRNAAAIVEHPPICYSAGLPSRWR